MDISLFIIVTMLLQNNEILLVRLQQLGQEMKLLILLSRVLQGYHCHSFQYSEEQRMIHKIPKCLINSVPLATIPSSQQNSTHTYSVIRSKGIVGGIPVNQSNSYTCFLQL